MIHFFLLVLGFIPLIFGADIFVSSASSLAKKMNIPAIVIGMTIVAFGTSLPELVTSIVAARKGQLDIAIGNVVGSNIFNIFFILGLSAIISPVAIHDRSILDIAVNIAASFLLFLFLFTGKGRRLERIEGIIMIALYLIYLTYLVLA